MPEILWKSYIDFEVEQEETDRARELYKRLLTKTQHVKVWLSLAKFELTLEHDDNVAEARHVYEEANKSLRDSSEQNPEAKEHRVMLLEAWYFFLITFVVLRYFLVLFKCGKKSF
jgi:crooked neck